MTHVYLLRRHPRYPYSTWNGGRAFLDAFTVEGVFTNREEPAKIAEEKNKKSGYLWTVSKREVK